VPDTTRSNIDTFFEDETIPAAFPDDVVYSHLTSHVGGWTQESSSDTVLAQLSNFNVILLVLPQRELWANENEAMMDFVNGFQKRIVFVGDQGDYYDSIGHLNQAMSAQGMSSQLGLENYDNSFDYGQYHNLSPSHVPNYLTDGAGGLWDNGVGSLLALSCPYELYWGAYQMVPFHAVGAELLNGQPDYRRIVVSDKDVFHPYYGANPSTGHNPYHASQSISNANAAFAHNLCTRW